MAKYPKHLKESLKYFDEFMKICRKRIIMGAKQYGDDWKRKDNLKELEFELFDIANYAMLQYAQLKYKKKEKLVDAIGKDFI